LHGREERRKGGHWTRGVGGTADQRLFFLTAGWVKLEFCAVFRKRVKILRVLWAGINNENLPYE